jgi:seryl-tRNA synthetase
VLDIKFIRRQPDAVKAGCRNKGIDADIDRILSLDSERKDLTFKTETLRHERKSLSEGIGRLMKEGRAVEAENSKKRVSEIKDELSSLESRLAQVEKDQQALLLLVPNMPLPDVPDGADEKANILVRQNGEPAKFSFAFKPHWEIGEKLGILDLSAGAKISRSGFPVFKGSGARLIRALLDFMLDMHTKEHGFTEVWVPPLVNRAAMTGTGQLPKFEFDMYRVEQDDLFLIPTAEVPVTNLVRDTVLDRKDLPMRLCAYSPCFRREAGAAGKDTRGLIRVHWFDKVEMVSICTPEQGPSEHEHMLSAAENVLKKLGLTYRVVLLCAKEMSFSNAKCFDIEVWCPGVEKWLEVSSVSTFTDFQARRMNTRFRGKDGALHFAYTLNGSGVAFPRLIISLLENYQTETGEVVFPNALEQYLK